MHVTVYSSVVTPDFSAQPFTFFFLLNYSVPTTGQSVFLLQGQGHKIFSLACWFCVNPTHCSSEGFYTHIVNLRQSHPTVSGARWTYHLNSAVVSLPWQVGEAYGTMSTPSEINEEYDIIIAGGAPFSHSSPLFHYLLNERTSDRRHRWLCCCWPACSSRPRLTYPLTRGGASDVQKPCAHVACALQVARSAGLAYGARTHQQPERGTRRSLGGRAVWTVSWWWREYQRYVCVPLKGNAVKDLHWRVYTCSARASNRHGVHSRVCLGLR